MVDNFSAKLDLPRSVETVESIDANHMQMARCSNMADSRYQKIAGVLKHFIHSYILESPETGPHDPVFAEQPVQSWRKSISELSKEPSSQ